MGSASIAGVVPILTVGAINLWRRMRLVAVVLAPCVFLLASGWTIEKTARDSALPVETTSGGFTTSDTCRACHPGPYHSWHESFHRTMTQVARGRVVLAEFDGVVLEDRGHTTRFERRGDQIWVDLPDPVWFMDSNPNKVETPPRINVPIVMTTGSHHMQYYWIRRPKTGPVYQRHDHGTLMSIPWVWLIEQGRWIPVQDSFLAPPNPVSERPLLWNTSCFACHSVATQPQYSFERDEFKTQSVELGIACEACHGPAEEHVRVNRSPLRRYMQYFSSDAGGDPTIVNPARLDSARSRDVCGQCHSFSEPLNPEAHQQTGVGFRPGDDLSKIYRMHRYPKTPAEEQALRDSRVGPDGNFWTDGTIRVAGREYNGLMESKCATRGELTCLTCHSMHDYLEPADQLVRGVETDATCVGCHESIGHKLEEHTHHAASSAGSSCMNCHMPHTTYGLFVAMRSHRIDSPSAANQAQSGRPNACNLCHLDQTLEWTGERLHEWYGQPRAAMSKDDRTIAASVLWAVKGNAVQRGLVAWHMGWQPARDASGRKWLGAYLSILLLDPYVAVRRVAYRSIETLPGFSGFEFDFAAPQESLLEKQSEAVVRWQKAMAGQPDRSGPQLLQNARGGMNQAELKRIYAKRDHRPIRISE